MTEQENINQSKEFAAAATKYLFAVQEQMGENPEDLRLERIQIPDDANGNWLITVSYRVPYKNPKDPLMAFSSPRLRKTITLDNKKNVLRIDYAEPVQQ